MKVVRLCARSIRKYWPQGLLAIVILYFAFPSFMDSLEQPAFYSQHGCPPNAKRPDGAGDPITIPRPNSGRVIVIRLTNSGQFVDRCELTDALYELVGAKRMAFGPRWRKEAKELPRLTLLYVHGWKHDDKSEDLQNFQTLVGELNDIHKDKKQVLGVYVAWNASWHLGWINNLSFWSKERAADRIAESAVLTKILSALGASRRKDLETPDLLIAIGHSFGARMLFAAAGQTLIYETANMHPGQPGREYGVVRGAADAIVLLNPAFEASMYTALDGVRRSEEYFSAEQAPLLVSIASSGDNATKRLFPIGQWFGGSRTKMELTTVGNYEEFVTHRLTRNCNSECSGNDSRLSEEFLDNGLCLKRTDRSDRFQRFNPFIVASTTDEIISDHNDIWNVDFQKWLGRFIEALEAKHRESRARKLGTQEAAGG